MTAAREKNFISAVVYLHNEEGRAAGFLEMLRKVLEERFEQYEIVAVDDASSDGTAQEVRRFAAEQMEKPLTLLHMSLRQGREKCMNAGQDCAIGDFVYEFDSILTPYPEALIFQAYQTALQGSDVVTVGPSRVRAGSRLFYGVFNRFSRSAYPLGTDAFCKCFSHILSAAQKHHPCSFVCQIRSYFSSQHTGSSCDDHYLVLDIKY